MIYKCFQCGKPLPPMTDMEAIYNEIQYRESNPGVDPKDRGERISLCIECFLQEESKRADNGSN